MFASPKPMLLASAVCVLATGLAVPLLAQTKPANAPIAQYDMRAGTITGVGAMGRGMGSAMGMMFGGGGGNNGPQHELYLRLGSSQASAKGAPKADHFMPPAAKLGKSVPLLTPQSEREPRDELPQMGNERPKGRILIFWGCAEHAPKGQPVVIDLAKIGPGQVPSGLWSGSVVRDWGPTLGNSKTFGRWPNEDVTGSNKAIRTDSSLLGDHRVVGNYSPEIAFTLAKDFMPPLNVTNSTMPSGAGIIRWGPVSFATGYYATLFGAKQGPNGQTGDMVMWSSSGSQQFGGALQDWLLPSQVTPLVANKTIMPPSMTTCIVPAEVRAATDFRMGTLTAYGPTESFAFPPRPSDPKAEWNPQWTARIRHRSQTSWMDMPGMPAGMGSPGPQQPAPACKPKGLGGIMGGVMGGVLAGKTGC